jgi:hypothetical protein
MKQEPNRDWDEIFKSVEKDAGITLNEKIRKRIIEAYHSYHCDHHVFGELHLSSKQFARAVASIERKVTRSLIALQSCSGDVHDFLYSDAIPASMSSSDFHVMTKSMDALVKRLRQSKRIAARGRRPDDRVDLLSRRAHCLSKQQRGASRAEGVPGFPHSNTTARIQRKTAGIGRGIH